MLTGRNGESKGWALALGLVLCWVEEIQVDQSTVLHKCGRVLRAFCDPMNEEE